MKITPPKNRVVFAALQRGQDGTHYKSEALKTQGVTRALEASWRDRFTRVMDDMPAFAKQVVLIQESRFRDSTQDELQ